MSKPAIISDGKLYVIVAHTFAGLRRQYREFVYGNRSAANQFNFSISKNFEQFLIRLE